MKWPRSHTFGYAVEEVLEVAAQLFRILELAISHITDFFELAQEGGLDRGMLPHCEKHRRARLGEDVVGDLERSALAHRRSNVKEGIGAAELIQAVASEIYSVERLSLSLLEMLSEGALR